MSESGRLIAARGLRGFVDGAVNVVLSAYLLGLGLSTVQVGAVATATLLGSALLTLGVGLASGRFAARTVLLGASGLMALTGLGFAGLTAFWPLLLVAFVGTLNPTSGDVSIFLPTEQAVLGAAGDLRTRTATFARYNVAGALLGAAGALAGGLPDQAVTHLGVGLQDALRGVFVLYACVALPLVVLYLGLPSAPVAKQEPRAPLARSRSIVLRLTALFSLDSFGGGLAVPPLVALWLNQRFGLSLTELGTFFFAASTLSAFSQFLSAWLAARIGLIETMVFTHLPANGFLIAAVFMPSAPLALGCLLVRGALSQMDVPARQSYVMAVVPPEERAAAASVTNVPRALASALSPLLAGALLERSAFGWPLLLAGSVKILYDLLLLWQFRAVPPAAR
ncbi:MAG TPA: MFS transporter [Myxococcota bacterium]|nr:MFS transporter [Myxococcota bacterium]